MPASTDKIQGRVSLFFLGDKTLSDSCTSHLWTVATVYEYFLKLYLRHYAQNQGGIEFYLSVSEEEVSSESVLSSACEEVWLSSIFVLSSLSEDSSSSSNSSVVGIISDSVSAPSGKRYGKSELIGEPSSAVSTGGGVLLGFKRGVEGLVSAPRAFILFISKIYKHHIFFCKFLRIQQILQLISSIPLHIYSYALQKPHLHILFLFFHFYIYM